MSEEQLSALLAKLKEDAGLMEKLKAAGDLDTAVAFAKEAGFDVSKADWLKNQAKQTLELSDEELEMAGGAQYSGAPKCGGTRDWIFTLCGVALGCDKFTIGSRLQPCGG